MRRWNKSLEAIRRRNYSAGGQEDSTAQIILLLIRANFLASDCCYSVEMQAALRRQHSGEAMVIPILLQPCDWEHSHFGLLDVLPRESLLQCGRTMMPL
jgi:hypothetical protein